MSKAYEIQDCGPSGGLRELNATERTALRALLAAATPEPWRAYSGHDECGARTVLAPETGVGGGEYDHVGEVYVVVDARPDDVAVIVALRNAAPALIDALDRAERVEAAARAYVAADEYVNAVSMVMRPEDAERAQRVATEAWDALRAALGDGGGTRRAGEGP